jgi:hypothetical protein
MLPAILDGTLFSGTLAQYGLRFRRAGRVHPFDFFPDRNITADIPKPAQIGAVAKLLKEQNAPLLFVETEWSHPAWGFGFEQIQQTMNKYAAIHNQLRSMLPGVPIADYNVPVPGDYAARNLINSWTVATTQPQRLGYAYRMTFDVDENGHRPVSKSAYFHSVNACACSCYYQGDSNLGTDLSPADAWERAYVGTKNVCQWIGLPMWLLVRIVAKDDRTPVPLDVCQRMIAVAKRDGVPLIVWEDEIGVPADAPMLQVLRDKYPAPRPLTRPPARGPMGA